MGRNKQGGAAAYLQNRYSDRTLQIEKFAPLVKRIALHLKVKLPPSVELDESFVTDTLADASIDIEDLPLLTALWETGRLEAFGLEFT